MSGKGRHGWGGRGGRPYVDEGTAEMTSLIKNAQRTNPDWSKSWAEYCETFGNGRADPARHSITFLMEAIKTIGLPQGEVEKQKLATKVKSYQRASPDACDAWKKYCDDHGDGTRYDPSLYDLEFLKSGLELLETACPEGPPVDAFEGPTRRPQGRGGYDEGTNESHLVYEVKEQQKTDPVAHKAWVEYCDNNSDGTRDPKRFDDGFLARALSHMRRAGHLVADIKDMTRAGGRTIWRRYCDEHGNSRYDPLLHDTSFLEKACEYTRLHLDRAQGVVSGGGRGRGGGGSGRGGGGSSRGRGESNGSSLVDTFKDFQRNTPGFPDWWRAHCDSVGDGVYDPARHGDDFLQDAMDDFSAEQ